MTRNNQIRSAARLSVAPMMDRTDRHCRYFHRIMSKQVLLYTEMLTSAALIRGGARHLLAFDAIEQPVALQLGGADPKELAEAAFIGAEEGYGEINLNVGCPSDRVQSGAFGAALMKTPALVGDCLDAMGARSAAEITVKCRIGVDAQNPHEVLPEFLSVVKSAGVRRVTIHARKAILAGLNPKENRHVPPLDYALVRQMKQQFPDLHISLNGGVMSLKEAKNHLEQGLDGVMIGRAAYHDPAQILCRADAEIFGGDTHVDPVSVVHDMLPYITNHVENGGRLHQISRHMLGLFNGRPGARAWRRHLSEIAPDHTAGARQMLEALNHVTHPAQAA